MSNSLRDDEASPDAQLITHAVDCIDTPLFAEANQAKDSNPTVVHSKRLAELECGEIRCALP